jgi:hypothetical protein
MSAYFTRLEATNGIPDEILIPALDDDGDGQEDDGRYAALAGEAFSKVDGLLAGRYATPFVDPVPAKVKQAALAFFRQAVYFRRRVDPNPYSKPAAAAEEELRAIAGGQGQLDAAQPLLADGPKFNKRRPPLEMTRLDQEGL